MVELISHQTIFDYERLDHEEKDEITPTLVRARQDLEDFEEEGDNITTFDEAGDHPINMGNGAALFTRSPKLNIAA